MVPNAWSAAATWKGGKLPTAGANVQIPKGKTVTLDQALSVSLRTVRVDGTLKFAPDRDTSLLLDTMVVMPGGELIVGTDKAPIARDKRARIIFADGQHNITKELITTMNNAYQAAGGKARPIEPPPANPPKNAGPGNP